MRPRPTPLQGIKAQIDEWYREKIQPIKDVFAETEKNEFQQFIGRFARTETRVQVPGLRDEGGRSGPKRLPERRR